MKCFLVFLLFFAVFQARSQCNIISQVQPNGTVNKLTKKDTLYVTKSYTLFSAAFYAGKNYYFKLVVKPTFFKKVKKEQVTLQLSTGAKVKLDFYDAQEVKKDSAMDILFEISEKVLPQLVKNNVHAVSFSTDSGVKRYQLVDHRALLRKQLNCLIEEVEKKK